MTDPLDYDSAQISQRPCVCGRRISRPSQCEDWRKERGNTTTCPFEVYHSEKRKQAAA